MSAFRSRRTALFVVLAIIFLASTVAYVIAVLSEVPERTLLYEGAKTLPQVGLVAVAAALVSYFVYEYQQARGRSDADLGVLRDILSAITAAYSDLKTSRRMMRAQGLRPVDGAVSVRTDEYDTLLAVVDTVQLRFERLVQDVAANDIFGDQAGCMRALKRIEQALHRLISEYEESRPVIDDAPTTPLGSLPELGRFLARGSDDPAKYRAGFFPITSNLWELRRVLRADVLRLSGVTQDRAAVRDIELQSEWRYADAHLP